MKIQGNEVCLLNCKSYDRQKIKEAMDRICVQCGVRVANGVRVLLKPNLVSAKGHDGIACTHPEFVAAAAEWFIDHGAVVSIGDSPAFGSGKKVMDILGITESLAGLPVKFADFTKIRKMKLSGGTVVGVAADAFDCDFLANLPKLKTHVQLLVSFAVKNYFGTVVGFRKPWIHGKYGDVGNKFEEILVDLLDELPAGISLIDGIQALHEKGPIKGKSFPLGLIGGAINPVALDTALLDLFGIKESRSPLWKECARREHPGSYIGELIFPLKTPGDFCAEKFKVPARLSRISFNPMRLVHGSIKRIFTKL
ncbi:MAG: DUF362 domain-containing protein [Proteobacteria bacterium]|nr:DUF362 domain-containing protein [Pseudomonadota bacterium]MBU1708872.1 DUF362 domain-containing protein [Pseudomonadota bacterium]